jgi:hypothetical protein
MDVTTKRKISRIELLRTIPKSKKERKMRKMELSFGGGLDTIIYDMSTRSKYSYKQESKEIHNLYGGKQFYVSCSGLSGKGFIDKNLDNLLELGVYRIGINTEIGIKIKDNISSYAPIWKNAKEYDAPIVLSDGNQIVFTTQRNLLEDTMNFYDLVEDNPYHKHIEVNLKYYNEWGESHSQKYNLFINNKCQRNGPDVRRFLNLSNIKPMNLDAFSFSQNSFFQQKLCIDEVVDYCQRHSWWHRNEFDYIDKVWKENPSTIEGEIVDGWYGDGEGLFWKRRDLKIEAFMEVETITIDGVGYCADQNKYTEYEEEFPIVEWYHKEKTWIKEYFMEKITKKAKFNYEYLMELKLKEEEFKKCLNKHKELKISIQDSLNAGNCKVGTLEFIEKWNIDHIEELLKHPEADKLFKNNDFRRTIIHKLTSLGIRIPVPNNEPCVEIVSRPVHVEECAGMAVIGEEEEEDN